MGRAGGWQAHRRQTQVLQAGGMAKTLGPIVRDGLQPGAALAQGGEVIHHGVADLAVQAALAFATGVHIPQAHTAGQQPVTPDLIAAEAANLGTTG